LLNTVAVVGQLIGSFGILLLLTFLKALSLKRLPVYLRQHAIESSTLGMFKYQHTVLLGSGGCHLRCLNSIGVRKVLVELALYNKTYYFC
jgi:hypothetical protein